MVAGPVDFETDGNFFSDFQRIEYAGLILTGAGLIGIGKPTICSAANLAYRKKFLRKSAALMTSLILLRAMMICLFKK